VSPTDWRGVYLFVVMVEDRHADPDVEVFVEKDDAIRRARALAEEGARHPGAIEVSELNNAMVNDGWVWHCRYSGEGDWVTVMARQLQ
jgi:hypothetical protein